MLPVKPFENYRWRWLHVQPTEGLLKPPAYLGVLRALEKCQGEKFSSQKLYKELRQVNNDIETSINLARTPERNLFRNSKQYWTGTGVLANRDSIIELTPLGVKIADGSITQDEFASLVIKNTILPNPITYSEDEIRVWRKAHLKIRPFVLILDIVYYLNKHNGEKESYITPSELIKIIIPLAGFYVTPEDISSYIYKHRKGNLNISRWPDCAPGANDRRLAREFLLFMEFYNVCRVHQNTHSSYDTKFYFESNTNLAQIASGASFFEDSSLLTVEEESARQSILPVLIERNRVLTSGLSRSSQSKFRKEVFTSCRNKCLITDEDTKEVLEAAHIIPVVHGGQDTVDNGICLRVDLHRLFDAGKVKILPTGDIILHETVVNSPSYSILPQNVRVLSHIIECLKWRHNYL